MSEKKAKSSWRSSSLTRKRRREGKTAGVRKWVLISAARLPSISSRLTSDGNESNPSTGWK